MKLFIKHLFIVASLGLMVCSSQAASLRVTLLTVDELGVYQEFANAFSEEMERQNISLKVDKISSLPTETDLIIAVGIKSLILAGKSRFPVLGVMVSKAGFEKLLTELPANREKNSISAIYFDQPVKRQVALISAALPKAGKIGILFSAHTPDIANLRKAVREKGLGFSEQQLESSDTLFRDLESVLKKSDVLLATPDPDVYNSLTMRNILLATYRRNVPVVGFSPAYVRAGALCAVFSTPGQIAKQAVNLGKQFIGSGVLTAPQYPVEFDVLVNRQVAYSMGIQIKENAVLAGEIKAAARAKEGGD